MKNFKLTILVFFIFYLRFINLDALTCENMLGYVIKINKKISIFKDYSTLLIVFKDEEPIMRRDSIGNKSFILNKSTLRFTILHHFYIVPILECRNFKVTVNGHEYDEVQIQVDATSNRGLYTNLRPNDTMTEFLLNDHDIEFLNSSSPTLLKK